MRFFVFSCARTVAPAAPRGALLSVWSKCQWVSMTHFTGALPRPSRASLSLGQAGATKVSTTNFPSGPLSTTTLPPGPENIVTPSPSGCVLRGAELNLARILASRSAGDGVCCASAAAEARSGIAGNNCARRALPASVAEPRNISRREVCFSKKLNFMFFASSLDLLWHRATASSAAVSKTKNHHCWRGSHPAEVFVSLHNVGLFEVSRDGYLFS